MKKLIILASSIFILLLVSCSDGNSPSSNEYKDNGTKALVVVVENGDGIKNGIYQQLLDNYNEYFKVIFSNLFGGAPNDYKGKTFDQIMENYGEDWQIQEISRIAELHYNDIKSLTDKDATADNLLSVLEQESKAYDAVDLVLCLHGKPSLLCFQPGDKGVSVADFTTSLKNRNIKIRAVYQTTNSGKSMMKYWEDAGVYAINGSEGDNDMILYSPQNFIKEWVAGKTYNQAIESAYSKEVDQLKDNESQANGISTYLSDDKLKNSQQSTGGKNSNILFTQVPVR